MSNSERELTGYVVKVGSGFEVIMGCVRADREVLKVLFQGLASEEGGWTGKDARGLEEQWAMASGVAARRAVVLGREERAWIASGGLSGVRFEMVMGVLGRLGQGEFESSYLDCPSIV